MLIGCVRTSKTPLSMVLAHKTFKVATFLSFRSSFRPRSSLPFPSQSDRPDDQHGIS
ncbi:kinase/pyrophosphorylase [Cohnella faecalis]|uniref:kinase/pyrophosphorylase n=1 Tax=Cohnella faecalis TaxID=2315694 RepID=UPI003989AD14